MAKKKNTRPNLPQETLARARAQLHGETVIETKKEAEAKPATPQAQVTTSPPKAKIGTRKQAVSIEDLKAEYVYVLSDLQSMFVLASILFVAMIAVSLILSNT